MKTNVLRLESLEARRVMSASPLVQPLKLELTDGTANIQHVEFFLDDGDGAFDAEMDQLIATDHEEDDGWSASVQTDGPYRIMAIGDSITQARAPYHSYRYPLAQGLEEAGYDFDFVGSRNGTDGELFDADHEGYWGWRADHVLARLSGVLDQIVPDVVLMHLGTNDSFQEQSVSSTMTDLENIINELRDVNPNVVVFSSLLIPTAHEWNDRITEFNAELPDMVQQWNTTESPVILVDMNSQIDPVHDLYDGVHPNDAGERKMAEVWLSHIQEAIPLASPSVFGQGEHTLYAVATHVNGNRLVSTSTANVGDSTIKAQRFIPTESILGVNASQEIWVARSNGRTLDTTFGGTWQPKVPFSHLASGDVNGDGLDDVIVRQENGRLQVALAKGSSSFTFEDWGSLTNVVDWTEFHVADFNGDGMDDIAGRAATDGTWWVGESTGYSFVNSYWGRFPVSVGWSFVVGDFDGDGQQDLAGRAESDGTWWTGMATNSRFRNRYAGQWAKNNSWSDILVGDFNGDGSDDIVGRANNTAWWIGTSQHGAFTSNYWTTWNHASSWEDVMVGDFDGDGRDDVAGRGDGMWWITASESDSGRHTPSTKRWGYWTTATTWNDVRVIDVNGDGYDDIIGRAANGEWWNFEAQANDTFKGVLAARWASAAKWQHVGVGNFS